MLARYATFLAATALAVALMPLTAPAIAQT
jgi:hypothetical protein